MFTFKKVHVFIEGEALTFNDLKKKSHEDSDFPVDMLVAFAIRVIKELLSSNKMSQHKCEPACRQIFAITIGRTDTRIGGTEIKQAIPRFVTII